MNYKLSEGKVLVKCKHCENKPTWKRGCTHCGRTGYQEYKEPRISALNEDRYINDLEYHVRRQREREEYQAQLKHWQEVKRLLEVDNPTSNQDKEVRGMADYVRAQNSLEVLYKHQS